MMLAYKVMGLALLATPALAAESGTGGSLSAVVLVIVLTVCVGKRLLTICERLPKEPR